MNQPDLMDWPVLDDALEYLDRHRDAPEGRRKRGLKLLVEMIDVETAEFQAAGHDDEAARKLAVMVVRSLARYFGGRMAYLPVGQALEDALRDKYIWDTHHRSPWRDTVQRLARQFGLTETRIYQIIEEQRSLYVARVQHSLPLDN